MDITVETTPESDAQFHIHLTWNEIDRASDRVYKQLAQRQKIPGFRPGHAPRTLIERIVGKDALYEEAIDTLIDEAVRARAKEQQLTLLESPHAHVHQINYGEDHEVDLTIPFLGKGELGDYSSIMIHREPVEVTEADIDTIIERMRNDKAFYVPVDRPAQIGDRVTVDLRLTINDKEINNLKDHEFDLVDDRTGLFTGMDQEIVGMADGEEKTFTTTLPDDYAKTDYAGQTAHYVVTLNKIALKTLPEVDDEFAKETVKIESLAKMREAIRDELTVNRTTAADRKLRDQAIDQLIQLLVLPVPAILIEAETEDLLRELDDAMQSEQLNLNTYLQMMGLDRDQYRQTMQPEAQRRIRQRRALELMADREGITVADRDVQEMLDRIARTSGRGRTRVQHLTPAQRTSVMRGLVRDRTLAWFLEQHTTAEPAAIESDQPDALAVGAEHADITNGAATAAASTEAVPSPELSQSPDDAETAATTQAPPETPPATPQSTSRTTKGQG